LSVNKFDGVTKEPRKSFRDKFSYTPRLPFDPKYNSTCAENNSRSRCQHSNRSDVEIDDYGSNYADLIFGADAGMKDEEDGSLYDLNQLLEGDDAGDYDAISPLDSEDHDLDSAAVVPLATATEFPTNIVTSKGVTAEGKENSGGILLGTKSGKRFSSNFERVKLPLANRKRLIDEILDCEQLQNSRCTPSSSMNYSFSNHTKPKETEAVSFQNQYSNQCDLLSASPMPNLPLRSNLNRSSSSLVNSNEFHQPNSIRKAETCTSPKTKKYCSFSITQKTNSFLGPLQTHGGPLPCSFFAAGQQNERYILVFVECNTLFTVFVLSLNNALQQAWMMVTTLLMMFLDQFSQAYSEA